ncbi:hypothetical protein D3C73_1671630 [compost metagenome]
MFFVALVSIKPSFFYDQQYVVFSFSRDTICAQRLFFYDLALASNEMHIPLYVVDP